MLFFKTLLCGLMLTVFNGCYILEREPLPLSLGMIGLISAATLIFLSTKNEAKKKVLWMVSMGLILFSFILIG